MRNMRYTTVFQMKHALHTICLSMKVTINSETNKTGRFT